MVTCPFLFFAPRILFNMSSVQVPLEKVGELILNLYFRRRWRECE